MLLLGYALTHLLWRSRPVAARLERRIHDESLEHFAQDTGLLAATGGRCAGQLEGFTLALFIAERPAGLEREDAVVLRCALGDAAPADLVLTRESFGGRLAPLLRRTRGPMVAPRDGDSWNGVRASEADFDAAFALDGQGSEARALLSDPAVRLSLLGALQQSQTLCVAKGVLELSARRGFDAPAFSALLEAGLGLARAMRAARVRSGHALEVRGSPPPAA
jgi:hypothetical protein